MLLMSQRFQNSRTQELKGRTNNQALLYPVPLWDGNWSVWQGTCLQDVDLFISHAAVRRPVRNAVAMTRFALHSSLKSTSLITSASHNSCSPKAIEGTRHHPYMPKSLQVMQRDFSVI